MKMELKSFSARFQTNPEVANELTMHLNVHLMQNQLFSRKIYVTYERRQKKAVYIELRWKSGNTRFFIYNFIAEFLYDLARTLGWQNSVNIKSASEV